MRYGVCIPQANKFADPEAIRTMARAVEDLGFDSLWVSDHVIVPEGGSYIPEMILEPLALLAFLGAETRHVTLGTSVLIVPYRDPVFTAKFLGTVDQLAGGRLVVGIGAGWLQQEFQALSAPFEERGAATDEYLKVYRNLWETETSTFAGKWKNYENMRMFPKASPSRRGTIPIWVGGNSPRSIRRAVELGDGWHPIGLNPEKFAETVAIYRSKAEAAGKTTGPVSLRITPGAGSRAPLWGSREAIETQVSEIRAYEAAGLDELVLAPNPRSVDDLVTSLRRFMREVPARV